MKSHLTKHVKDLYNLSIQYKNLKSLLYSNIGVVLGNIFINIAWILLSKLVSAPIINLSNYNLSNQERQQLKLNLDYCFVDKNKDVWRFLTANMESLADSVKGNIDHKNLEHFH